MLLAMRNWGFERHRLGMGGFAAFEDAGKDMRLGTPWREFVG
jgi:hypothetical protein